MKNLRNIARAAVNFGNDTPLPLTATTWDTSTNALICAFGPTPDAASIELRRVAAFDSEKAVGAHISIAEWDAQCPNPDLACDKILDLHYFADTSVVCLILAGGDLVLVREAPLPEEELLEIVGSVDAGIKAAAWSPDEELLVLVTGEGNVLFMSRRFEAISEAKFKVEDQELSKHVNVGWGKKETQFLGKRARALRDPTVPEHVDEGKLSETDDGEVRVTWRGDGEYVAVNAVEEGARRLMRVYSREGLLESVSEPVDGFEGPLAWRPAGNIICGVRRTAEKSEVIFFERNGLRHGEFDLRMTKEEIEEAGGVKDLKWNVDSTVLAVVFGDRVQLWTMGNYYWYLKQEIQLPGGDKVTGITWHPETPLKLAIHGEGQASLLEYAFTTTKGSTCSPNDYGLVAVIDGKNVKLTPLRIANIPPPMAHHELQLRENAVDVAIDSQSSLVYILTQHGVSIYNYAAAWKDFSGPTFVNRPLLNAQLGIPLQIAICKNRPVVLAYDASAEAGKSVIFSLSDTAQIDLDVGTQEVRCIGNNIDKSLLWVETSDGAVLGIDDSMEDMAAPHLLARLPKFCPHIEVAVVGDEEIVFGLTSSGSLYANHLLLVSNCTSFLVTPAHLIFTTTHHLLQFVHLTSVDELEVPPNEPETDERCRAIERGARLVTVMPSSYAVVLQMPRGNLETIYPRALVLANIRQNIEAKKYKKAFLACRAQRVDMNILHDHAPAQFMANAGLFLDQLKKVEYVDLFLSCLKEEDVSKTMYKETVQSRATAPVINGVTNGAELETSDELVMQSKVNRICDALLKELESRRATNLQNIVTANVCKSPPDLEGGLSVVSKLREQGEDIAEKAAEQICFLADVNQLYDTALGMYDLELTLLIAQQSQKDPKEYIPYLQSVQDMPCLRRQFTIDNDLGKHRKAIESLHEMDAFEEVQRYAEKHELYSTAIELNKYKPERLNALMKQYADFLSGKYRFMEAGVAYEFLKDYAAAVPAYRQAGRWQEALSCASLARMHNTELEELADSLAEGLVESKEYQGAAIIYLDYLSNTAEAVRNLCKAYQFAEAIRVVSLRWMHELLDEVIDPGLTDAFTSTTELLADCKSQLQAQVPRLRDLRQKKEQDPLAFYTGDAAAGEAGADFPDNVSLAPTDATTSAGTFMTRYTGHTNGTLNTQTTRRTSKNRRREERKRARGKKGSVYEEEYIVNSIGRLIERVNGTADEVARLVEGLVRRGMREQAVNVEKAMADVVVMCETVVPEVWEVKDKTGEEEEEGKAHGADGVYMDMVEGGGKMEKPTVKKFERLSLIA